jgi:hypothetical protein
MTISIGKRTDMILGRPNGTQRDRRVVTLPARPLVGQARLELRLVFGRERRLLAAALRLGRVPLLANAGRSAPLTGEVGIFRFIECLGADRQHERRGKRDRTDEVSV